MGKTEQMRLAPRTPSYSGLAVTFGATIFEHKGQRYRHSTLQVLLLNPFLWGSSPQAWQATWMLERQILFLKPLVRRLWRFCARLRSEMGLRALSQSHGFHMTVCGPLLREGLVRKGLSAS